MNKTSCKVWGLFDTMGLLISVAVCNEKEQAQIKFRGMRSWNNLYKRGFRCRQVTVSWKP